MCFCFVCCVTCEYNVVRRECRGNVCCWIRQAVPTTLISRARTTTPFTTTKTGFSTTRRSLHPSERRPPRLSSSQLTLLSLSLDCMCSFANESLVVAADRLRTSLALNPGVVVESPTNSVQSSHSLLRAGALPLNQRSESNLRRSNRSDNLNWNAFFVQSLFLI